MYYPWILSCFVSVCSSHNKSLTVAHTLNSLSSHFTPVRRDQASSLGGLWARVREIKDVLLGPIKLTEPWDSKRINLPDEHMDGLRQQQALLSLISKFKIHFGFESIAHFHPDKKYGLAIVVHCEEHRRSGWVEKPLGIQILMLEGFR